MHEPLNNLAAPFLGFGLPTYPVLPQVIRVGNFARAGDWNVYAAYTEQFAGTVAVAGMSPMPVLRDRESCYLWEPNGASLSAGNSYVSRLVGNYQGLPLYVTTCCISGSSYSSSSMSSSSLSSSSSLTSSSSAVSSSSSSDQCCYGIRFGFGGTNDFSTLSLLTATVCNSNSFITRVNGWNLAAGIQDNQMFLTVTNFTDPTIRSTWFLRNFDLCNGEQELELVLVVGSGTVPQVFMTPSPLCCGSSSGSPSSSQSPSPSSSMSVSSLSPSSSSASLPWTCDGDTNTCVQSVSGRFATKEDCDNCCGFWCYEDAFGQFCSGPPCFTGLEPVSGPYDNLTDCQSVCPPFYCLETSVYEVNGCNQYTQAEVDFLRNIDAFTVVGPYDDLVACEEECKLRYFCTDFANPFHPEPFPPSGNGCTLLPFDTPLGQHVFAGPFNDIAPCLAACQDSSSSSLSSSSSSSGISGCCGGTPQDPGVVPLTLHVVVHATDSCQPILDGFAFDIVWDLGAGVWYGNSTIIENFALSLSCAFGEWVAVYGDVGQQVLTRNGNVNCVPFSGSFSGVLLCPEGFGDVTFDISE